MVRKPDDVFDRDVEWGDLVDFAGSRHPGLRIAVVYGRRRQGKSYLLRRLAEVTGGLYHLATEQTEAVSLRRFARSLSGWLGTSDGLGFADWEAALSAAMSLMARKTPARHGQPPLLILDEFPYLARESPGLPSIVQGLYDRICPGSSETEAPARLVLCGSAISTMSQLLSGTKALRGRAGLELRIKPFGHRESRAYWGIDNLTSAFLHNAIVGGTPGYRDIVHDTRVPEQPGRMNAWVARNILHPSAPLFDEANRIVHEDPRIRETAVYGSLLATIAAGESSPAKIGGLLGRPSSSLTHQLGMLESAGFIARRQDMLMDRRPAIGVVDPVVRLHHLVIEPYLAELEAGRSDQVWDAVQQTLAAKVLGPHFETVATDWVSRCSHAEAGLEVGPTGQATVPCPEHRTSHEIDILSLERGARPRTAGGRIAFLGEAKSRGRRPGMAEIERLDHIRDLLTRYGHDASRAAFGLFSANGFARDLGATAAKSKDRVLLVGLDQIYGTTTP